MGVLNGVLRPWHDNKQHASIEDWGVLKDSFGSECLYGVISAHPRSELMGIRCYTSAIVKIDVATNTVETANTIYKLGVPRKKD